jgi:hypothetical protein
VELMIYWLKLFLDPMELLHLQDSNSLLDSKNK